MSSSSILLPHRAATASRRARRLGVVLAITLVAATPVALSATEPASASTSPVVGLWSSTARPSNPADPDRQSVTLGVQFSSAVDGTVTGIEFYRSSKNVGQHVGRLWGPNGHSLARVVFPATRTVGWHRATFPKPVTIRAGRRYIASYTAPHGRYAGDTGGLGAATPRVRGALTAWKGVYSYAGGRPTQTWRDSNYYVDVLFRSHRRMPTPTPTPTPTPAPTPTPTPAPTPASGKPGRANTGVPSGTVLSAVRGGLTVTQDNAVIDAKDISGSVTIAANNVTIKRSKIHGTGSYGVYVRSGSVNVVDSELWGFENGIAFDNWTATRVNMHGLLDDGVKLGSNVTLADSWIHDMTPEAGAHADGGQLQGGSVNVTVRHNTIDMASGSGSGNAALFIAPDLGPSSPGPLTITGNWLDGGNYTLFCVDGNNGQYYIKNITISSNRFGTNNSYGPSRVNVPVTQSGNVWDRTGASLRLG